MNAHNLTETNPAINSQMKGRIVEKIIRSRGYKLSLIAKKMQMSRATLYKKFKSNDLSDLFLFNLGKVIRVDFSEVFPELKNSLFYVSDITIGDKIPEKVVEEMRFIQNKYTFLLEDYNRLLRFFVKLIDSNEFHSVKNEISRFVADNMRKMHEMTEN